VSSSGCNTSTLTTDTPGVTLTCSATNGASLSNSFSVTIKIDKSPPIISGMPPANCVLWPPNHLMMQVATVTSGDETSGLVLGSFSVTGSSNQPSDPKAPDVLILPNGAGGFSVQLRADRLGKAEDRLYTLQATANDLAGNMVNIHATCVVPHDQR
jgi:hypothetical protein